MLRPCLLRQAGEGVILLMNLPDVVHPKLVNIGGYKFRIISFSPLTDDQALKVALLYCRSHRLTQKQKKKVLEIHTTFDEKTAGLL